MAIYTERIIRVNNNHASMDKDIYVYRGNRNIEIQFTIVDHQFKFKDVNLVEQVSPSHAYVTLLTPQMLQIGTGKAEVQGGVIKLVINSAMIDEKTECGDYTIVIDLYDEVSDALITIPPIENQLHVLDRMTEIDDVPDELRFIFDAQTGNLEVANIDLTYDETSGEIKTIEGIPLHDKTARRLIENIGLDVNEYQETVDELQGDMLNAKTEINRLSPIVAELVDSGYKQIKPNMSQSEIQNELNKAGIIIIREGVYNLNDVLIVPNQTTLLMEKEVQFNFSSDSNALKLYQVKEVFIHGNLILNGSGILLEKCMDIRINGLCVNAAENGIRVVGGDNVVIDNLITQECSINGCSIENSDNAMNVEVRNHIDIQSTRSLKIVTNSNKNIAGKIHIINPFYEVSEEPDSCIDIQAVENGPNIIIDNPLLQVNNDKTMLINIHEDSSKLGNVFINKPMIKGEANINSYIKITGVNENSNVVLDIDNIIKVLNGDVNVTNDVCSSYIMPLDASVNVNMTLNDLPKGFECSFMNKSPLYFINIHSANIDNGLNVLQLRHNEYVKMKHIGNNQWVIMDENFRNKITTITPVDGILNVPNIRYAYVNITSETQLVLPNIEAPFAEIHLFVIAGGDGAFVYPEDIRWTNEEVSLETDNIFEFIFTKVNNTWLIGCVTYV